MKKKQISLVKLMTAFVFTLVLCFGMAAPAFADGKPTGWVKPTAAVTKLLKMPAGTNVPAMKFEFKIEKEAFNGLTSDKAYLPAIGNAEVEFKPTTPGYITVSTSSTETSVYQESGDIFANVTWPGAGIYTYMITEIPGSYPAINSGPFAPVKMDYSGAKYKVVVYVKEDDTTDPISYYIDSILAYIEINDDSNTSSAVGAKVDVTPSNPGETDYTKLSKMTFTNYYLKNNGGTDPGTDPTDISVLDITKDVTGDLGDKQKLFDFSVTVKNPAFETDANKTYKAFIKYADGSVSASPILFKHNTPVPFQLKHGDTLAFIDLPAGATYNITEYSAANYIPNYTITKTGFTPDASTISTVMDLVTGDKTLADQTTANDVVITNKSTLVIPGTGIVVDNLPYIMLIAFGAIAIAVFAIVKARRRANDCA